MHIYCSPRHKLSLLSEAESRRETWERLEELLSRDALSGFVGPDPGDPRPADLPRGPIEEYADRAWFVALSGFLVSFATTRSVQRAVAAIYGSLCAGEKLLETGERDPAAVTDGVKGHLRGNASDRVESW